MCIVNNNIHMLECKTSVSKTFITNTNLQFRAKIYYDLFFHFLEDFHMHMYLTYFYIHNNFWFYVLFVGIMLYISILLYNRQVGALIPRIIVICFALYRYSRRINVYKYWTHYIKYNYYVGGNNIILWICIGKRTWNSSVCHEF